jgi:SOS-response transcriptional repressor LexA
MKYSCRTLQAFPPNRLHLAVERGCYSARRAQTLGNMTDVLGRDPHFSGHSAINSEEQSRLFQFRCRTLKLQAQIGAPDCETEHNAHLHNSSRKIFMPPKSKPKTDVSSVASRIEKVRNTLGMSQTTFAETLGTRPSSISKWEAGKNRPSPDVLARIAKLCEGIDKLFFLEEAGIPEEYFAGAPMLREIHEASLEVVAQSLSGDTRDQRNIPLLRDAIAAGNPRGIDESEIVAQIPFLKRWLPRGAQLYAFKVAGDSMAPIICDGYLVIVDAAQRDPKSLVGQMVAAREGDGVTIKWLRKDKDTYLLVPQHVSPRIPVRVMREEDDWSIVGVVLKWIGYPPPTGK